MQRVEHRASGVVGTWSIIEPSPVPSATQRVNRATILNEILVREELARKLSMMLSTSL